MPAKPTIHDAILIASVNVGYSAPRITDEIIVKVFPRSLKELRKEGGDTIMRRGLIDHVTRALKGIAPQPNQGDFADIDSQFHSAVKLLHSNTYTVPSLGVRVAVADLIRLPSYLDEARKFMRVKGSECFEEADRLDSLYRLVTNKQTGPANDPGAKRAAKKAA